jgi:hypothetical protein
MIVLPLIGSMAKDISVKGTCEFNFIFNSSFIALISVAIV